MLLVQLPQLLFLLFGPRWPRSLSDTLTVMSYQFLSLYMYFKYCCDNVKMQKHQPFLAVAFGHLAYSPHIFPEQQFNVRLVVVCRQCKETVHHILGEGDQFL